MKKELPGHIKGAFRSIDHFLPVVDVVVELVDARMPEGSRLKGFVKRLDKTSVIALSKSDLADPAETQAWLDRFSEEGLSAVSLDCRNQRSVKQLAELIRKSAANLKPGQKVPARKVRRVMIIGIPNVGKSTLINSLTGRRAAKAANKPGVTRSIQWIKLNGELELLDLPGILDFSLMRRGDILKLINTVPGNDDDTYTQASTLAKVLEMTGSLSVLPGAGGSEKGFDDFLEQYARSMNFFMRGAVPDMNRAATDVIKRFQSGGFGRVTLEKASKDFTDLFSLDPSEDGENNSNDDFD